MSLVESSVSWVRQSLTWSNSWLSWRERLVLVAFLAAAVGLGVLSFSVRFWIAAGLWLAYVIGVVVATRQGWLQLFGPVLFYDMIRTARRSRYVIMRLLYACLLLAVLCVIFADMSPRGARDAGRETAVLAEVFFVAFMNVQMLAVVLLTPAYVAGAISEEKERKTLEFMLATDLANHEIVLSKLLSRLANLALFLITGLPILSMLQFVGGVDTELMLASFAGIGMSTLGIASISILFSTLMQKPRDSIGLSYLCIVAYGALGTFTKVLALSGNFFMNETIWINNTGPTFAQISDWFNIGNPIAALHDVEVAINRASLAADLPGILLKYALFHGILSLVCITWSIVRLRAIALKQTVAGKTQRLAWWEHYRPPIGDLPMIWKELHIEGRVKLNWVGWGIVVVLIVVTIGSGVLVLAAYIWDVVFGGHLNWRDFREGMNLWFRVAGTGLGCLMLLMMAVRASTSISNERERDTFDALLTTPIGSEAILSAKLIGVLTSLRLAWLWFGAMIAIALFTGGVHLLAVPIFLGAWFIYAVFVTMVGMWFSMVCRSSMRATVLTVLTTLFLGGGHWIVMGLCCYFPVVMSARGGGGDFIEYVAKFQLGMTPPFVMGFCAYSWDNLARDFQRRDFGSEMFVFALIGLFLTGIGSVVMWYGILVPKFREITRREELIYQTHKNV